MKILDDEMIKEIVEEWYKTTPLYEALVLMGDQAQHKCDMEQVVEKLTALPEVSIELYTLIGELKGERDGR